MRLCESQCNRNILNILTHLTFGVKRATSHDCRSQEAADPCSGLQAKQVRIGSCDNSQWTPSRRFVQSCFHQFWTWSFARRLRDCWPTPQFEAPYHDAATIGFKVAWIRQFKMGKIILTSAGCMNTFHISDLEYMFQIQICPAYLLLLPCFLPSFLPSFSDLLTDWSDWSFFVRETQQPDRSPQLRELLSSQMRWQLKSHLFVGWGARNSGGGKPVQTQEIWNPSIPDECENDLFCRT